MVRKIGDFRIELDISEESALAALVPKLEKTRLIYVYIRKSDPSGHDHNPHYLLVQENVPQLLVSAGVPRAQIRLLEGDTGKSAYLSRQFRLDLAELFDQIGMGSVGTVVVPDISRLFRDAWLKEPASFASRIARHRTLIVTTVAGEWVILDLRKDSDLDQFMGLSKEAAAHRKNLRAQGMKAKELSATLGNYTGGPLPLGWAVRPGLKRYMTDDGKEQAPKPYVYEPHAELKLTIMELSLLPHITSWTGLSRHLRKVGLVIPPFDAATARECYSSTAISRVYVTVGGKRAQLRMDQEHSPSPRMLRNILLEPLAIGVRLYGSGEGAKAYLDKHLRWAKAMDQPPDTQVRVGKTLVGVFPDLAICNTPERVALFYDVWRKWARFDFDTLLNSGWDEEVENTTRTAGRGLTGKHSIDRVQHWAGKLLCMRHENPIDYKMSFNGKHLVWECRSDNVDGISTGSCSVWSNHDALTRILDAHLLRGIETALNGNRSIVRSLTNEINDRNAHLDRLRREERELSNEHKHLLSYSSSYRMALEDQDDAAVTAEMDKYNIETVRPVFVKLIECRREIARLESLPLTASSACSEVELRELLDRTVKAWVHVPVTDKIALIDLFVDDVLVLVANESGQECYVEFRWKNGMTDHLISWRQLTRDERPWTLEEDQVIRKHWRSRCSWAEIASGLLPLRKFSAVVKRTRILGVSKGANRAYAWKKECLEQERSWGLLNPGILYLQLSPKSSDYCLVVRQDGSPGEVIPLPDSVTAGLTKLFADRSCPSAVLDR